MAEYYNKFKPITIMDIKKEYPIIFEFMEEIRKKKYRHLINRTNDDSETFYQIPFIPKAFFLDCIKSYQYVRQIHKLQERVKSGIMESSGLEYITQPFYIKLFYDKSCTDDFEASEWTAISIEIFKGLLELE